MLFFVDSFGQFSWRNDTPVYADGNTSGHNYPTVGGTPSIDVSISAMTQGSSVAWQASNPRVPTSAASRLGLGVNFSGNDPAATSVTFTITFSQAVCGLTFPVYNIDRSSSGPPYPMVDELVINSTDKFGGALPTPTIMPSAFAAVSGNVITGISDDTATPGATTSIAYNSSQCVKTLTFTYRSGPDAQANPSTQLISIGDMNWTSALPITLASMKAEKQPSSIVLAWRTNQEINNSHFEIERSADAKSFETIGRVMGQGSSFSVQSYSFEDTSPRFGLNYYRLKQVDFDGKSEYSRLEVVRFDGQGVFRAYPNPTTDRLRVDFPNSDTQVSLCEVIDLLGRSVKQFDKPSDISLRDLPNGLYWLRCQTTDGVEFRQRVLKQN